MVSQKRLCEELIRRQPSAPEAVGIYDLYETTAMHGGCLNHDFFQSVHIRLTIKLNDRRRKRPDGCKSR